VKWTDRNGKAEIEIFKTLEAARRRQRILFKNGYHARIVSRQENKALLDFY
jgi:hypothetical protein